MTTLRPYDPNRRVEILGDLWNAKKKENTLRVEVRTHPKGWEIRALVGLEMHRSEICKTEQSVHDMSEAWKTEATAKGWS